VKKYFSISRKQTTIVITIITLAVLGAWYYLVYIPGNEKHLYEQHFRWVQNIDKNIRNKIDASDSLVGNLLKAYVDYKKPDSIAEKYIRKYYTRNIPISITTDTSQSKINAASDDVQFSLGTDSSMNGLIISAQKLKQIIMGLRKKVCVLFLLSMISMSFSNLFYHSKYSIITLFFTMENIFMKTFILAWVTTPLMKIL
jgi:hypothetical protein